MKKLHLVCNAHIDPIWLWEWEEGAAAALATFRSAVRLAEEYDYIFCHNEALIYQWIQEYEPALFEKIRRLVKEGRWHIMGGWYLQPDCNMPSGESLVRQIEVGRRFFREQFGIEPTTAVNFDPFGHSAGLVQILTKCGYDSYVVCRPCTNEMALPDNAFFWKGADGSVIKCYRAGNGYSSAMGGAADKIRQYLETDRDRETGLLLWGVGNHGGGASRQDLRNIAALMEQEECTILHSTPEQFFAEFPADAPVVTGSLYPSMVGCYTSQARIKQEHRRLENLYYTAERMCAAASIQGQMAYPQEQLDEALKSLLFSEFHDILPGSSIPAGEAAGLRLLMHGQELASRLRAKAFFALSAGQPEAVPGEYPLLVYNPHPYPVTQSVVCEFQLADINWGEDYTTVEVYGQEGPVPSQLIKTHANINLDWRKQVVFDCTLEPMSMNRFDCRARRIAAPPQVISPQGDILFENQTLSVRLGADNGLIEDFRVNGEPIFEPGAFLPYVIGDTVDPWAQAPAQTPVLGREIGRFTLLDSATQAQLLNLARKDTAPVRVVEDGAVQTVVEAALGYNNSHVVVQYVFYKNHPWFDLRYTVYWNEKSKAMKLQIPMAFEGDYVGETAYGRQVLPKGSAEVVSQKWSALSGRRLAVAILNNGTYGSSCQDNAVSLTLLRGAAYSSQPIFDRPLIPENRYTPHMDQGERSFSFRVYAGEAGKIMTAVPRLAQVFNESPYALHAYPSGEGNQVPATLTLSGNIVQLTAFKKETDGSYTLRLFNNSDSQVEEIVRCPALNVEERVRLTPYEVKGFTLKEGSLIPQARWV